MPFMNNIYLLPNRYFWGGASLLKMMRPHLGASRPHLGATRPRVGIVKLGFDTPTWQ